MTEEKRNRKFQLKGNNQKMPFNVKYIEPKIILQSVAWMHFEYVWNIGNSVLKSVDWNKEAIQNDIYYMDVGTCDGERKSNQNTIFYRDL